MSGQVCEIIIRGNRLQALMRSVIAQWTGADYPQAQLAIGNAQALCQTLAGLVYDGVEVGTDDQRDRATNMMQTLISKVEPLVNMAHHTGHHRGVILDAVTSFNSDAEALLAEVVLS